MQIYKLTNFQKILAAGVLVATAFVSAFMVMRTSQIAVKSSSASTAADVPFVQPKTNTMVKAEMPGAPAVQTQHSELPPQTAPMPELTSWQMGDVKAATPKIPLSEKIASYAIVQLEQHPAQLPVVGEQIQLPMLNGKSLVADVQSTTTNPNGDYTWSGHLQGYGSDYPVIMTYGEHAIFATITTPEGSFTMESLDGLGWLYKNPAEVELSNPGAKDFLDVSEAH